MHVPASSKHSCLSQHPQNEPQTKFLVLFANHAACLAGTLLCRTTPQGRILLSNCEDACKPPSVNARVLQREDVHPPWVGDVLCVCAAESCYTQLESVRTHTVSKHLLDRVHLCCTGTAVGLRIRKGIWQGGRACKVGQRRLAGCLVLRLRHANPPLSIGYARALLGTDKESSCHGACTCDRAPWHRNPKALRVLVPRCGHTPGSQRSRAWRGGLRT